MAILTDRGDWMGAEKLNEDLPVLETERLLLRRITLDDVEDIFAYGSIEEVTRYVTWDPHRTLSDTMEFVQFILNQYEYNKQVAPWGIEYKENGRLIGTINFISWQPKHKSAELGYVISPDYWGKGIGTEATKKVIEYGFENMDLVRIQARCLVGNIGSSRVMEKAGMTFEGILRKVAFIKGEHQDLKVYSILKDEFLL